LVPWNNQGFRETQEFYQRLMSIIFEFIQKTNDRNEKILDFHHPDQLMEDMDFTLPDEPQNLDQLLTDCKDTLKYQVKTGKERIFSVFHIVQSVRESVQNI
jgi:glutamate decarboxylase